MGQEIIMEIIKPNNYREYTFTCNSGAGIDPVGVSAVEVADFIAQTEGKPIMIKRFCVVFYARTNPILNKISDTDCALTNVRYEYTLPGMKVPFDSIGLDRGLSCRIRMSINDTPTLFGRSIGERFDPTKLDLDNIWCHIDKPITTFSLLIQQMGRIAANPPAGQQPLLAVATMGYYIL